LFVSSEANDLAIRISRRVGNGGEDIMVYDHAYHGHLGTLVDISPYKFSRKGGEGQKEWVHVVPIPDVYRGKYRNSEYNENELVDLYVQEVVDTVEKAEQNGRKICLFMVESLQSCGGQIMVPNGYLKKVHEYLKTKDIFLLADEVQCGFYRNGETMWSFQYYGRST
jgi:ethanolamine-phosphate phospho-lyase